MISHLQSKSITCYMLRCGGRKQLKRPTVWSETITAVHNISEEVLCSHVCVFWLQILNLKPSQVLIQCMNQLEIRRSSSVHDKSQFCLKCMAGNQMAFFLLQQAVWLHFLLLDMSLLPEFVPHWRLWLKLLE